MRLLRTNRRSEREDLEPFDLAALIEANLPRVRICALKLKGKMPYDVGRRLFNDLLGEGALGLVTCARRYDGRVAFGTFASWRIYGAMQDYLRRIDMLDKSERRDGCTLERSGVSLECARHVPSRESEWSRVDDSLDAKRLTRKLLRMVDPCSRRAVRLRYLKDRTLPQIARTMGISETWASHLITRAILVMGRNSPGVALAPR
jgi:RNA polymerase sigma factor (sigma-70 family)